MNNKEKLTANEIINLLNKDYDLDYRDIELINDTIKLYGNSLASQSSTSSEISDEEILDILIDFKDNHFDREVALNKLRSLISPSVSKVREPEVKKPLSKITDAQLWEIAEIEQLFKSGWDQMQCIRYYRDKGLPEKMKLESFQLLQSWNYELTAYFSIQEAETKKGGEK